MGSIQPNWSLRIVPGAWRWGSHRCHSEPRPIVPVVVFCLIWPAIFVLRHLCCLNVFRIISGEILGSTTLTPPVGPLNELRFCVVTRSGSMNAETVDATRLRRVCHDRDRETPQESAIHADHKSPGSPWPIQKTSRCRFLARCAASCSPVGPFSTTSSAAERSRASKTAGCDAPSFPTRMTADGWISGRRRAGTPFRL